MEAKFKPGDSVVLKSGSGSMTIDQVIELFTDRKFQYGCAYSRNGKIEVIFLHEDSLDPYIETEHTFYAG